MTPPLIDHPRVLAVAARLPGTGIDPVVLAEIIAAVLVGLAKAYAACSGGEKPSEKMTAEKDFAENHSFLVRQIARHELTIRHQTPRLSSQVRSAVLDELEGMSGAEVDVAFEEFKAVPKH